MRRSKAIYCSVILGMAGAGFAALATCMPALRNNIPFADDGFNVVENQLGVPGGRIAVATVAAFASSLSSFVVSRTAGAISGCIKRCCSSQRDNEDDGRFVIYVPQHELDDMREEVNVNRVLRQVCQNRYMASVPFLDARDSASYINAYKEAMAP